MVLFLGFGCVNAMHAIHGKVLFCFVREHSNVSNGVGVGVVRSDAGPLPGTLPFGAGCHVSPNDARVPWCAHMPMCCARPRGVGLLMLTCHGARGTKGTNYDSLLNSSIKRDSLKLGEAPNARGGMSVSNLSERMCVRALAA